MQRKVTPLGFEGLAEGWIHQNPSFSISPQEAILSIGFTRRSARLNFLHADEMDQQVLCCGQVYYGRNVRVDKWAKKYSWQDYVKLA
jgi:hypothetical protein